MMNDRRTVWQELGDIPHRLEFVQVGPWRTRVLTAGEGDETVVLANGTSGHLEAWAWNIRALASEYRVIGYDYPGHGYTTMSDHDLEIPEYEEHLLGLLDTLGLEKVHLAGESLGGWIAVKFAAHHPERLHSVVLSAPGGRMVGERRIDKAQSISRQAVEQPTFENVKDRLKVVIHDPDLITDELVEVRRRIYSQPGFPASMGHIAVLREPETRWRNRVTDEDFAAIPVPALLVWTEHEPSGGPEVGERLAASIPNGEYLFVEGAAHWPQWESPKLFNERALEFLRRQG